MSRSIKTIISTFTRTEGRGVHLKRSLGAGKVKKFNPFLLFDHFKGSQGSFPPHPHLGHETVTYMLGGSVAHEDFTGSRGIIREGDLQFMTAGRGIVHSEIPIPSQDGSPTNGLQLWVDLPAAFKETEPRYRDLRTWEIPEVTDQDGKLKVRVISGESYGAKSNSNLAYTPIHYYHFTLLPGARFIQLVPKTFNFFLYVVKGNKLSLENSEKPVNCEETVFFEQDGEAISGGNFANNSDTIEFVLIGGEVLDQKMLHYGAFVGTSTSRIQKGMADFENAREGFERVQTWTSLIGDGVTEEMINNELNGSYEARDRARRDYLETNGQN